MILPEPLRPGQHPLMPDDLVSRYNRLLALLAEISEKVPRLGAEIDAQAAPLATVRRKLGREKFPVGFLGNTQTGKSTTFNNLLGVHYDRGRRVSEEGVGDSTTAVVTRLRARPDGHDELHLRYMSETAFLAKRKMVCETVGLDPSADDATLLRQIPEVEARINAGDHPALIENPEYLRRLLLSRQKYGHLLGSAVQRADWPQRFNHLNHDRKNKDASPNLLLEDGLIDFRTDVVHPDMELIDVPGLGDRVEAVTEAAIKRLGDLDGAVVFVNVHQRADNCADKVFSHLMREYGGDFRDRVWLVFSKCDGFGPSFRRGPAPDHVNGFESMMRMVVNKRVPPDQAFLITNKLLEMEHERGRPLTDAETDIKVGFARDQMPQELDAYPSLKAAFLDLYADGGFGRLRDLFRTTLPPKVRARTEEEVRTRLRKVCQKVEGHLVFAKSQSSQDLLPAVNAALKAVRQQIAGLTAPGPRYGEALKGMREELEHLFTLHFADDERNNAKRLADVNDRFPGDAGRLDGRLAAQFHQQAEAMYEQVGAAFAGLPPLPVLEKASVEEAWKGFAAADCKDARWAGADYPRFRDDRLFAHIHEDEADRIDGACYRRLIKEKVRTATRTVLHLIRWRVVGRLEELDRTLDALTRIRPDDGRNGPVNYDEMIQTLRTLCP